MGDKTVSAPKRFRGLRGGSEPDCSESWFVI